MKDQPPFTLTLEPFLYGLIFAAALGLRLLNLGAHPLNDVEAREALTVLGQLRGAGDAALGPHSPAYFFFTFFSFLLFGAREFTARLGPALAGAALVLAPALFRDKLGRGGALGAAALLAVSTSLLAASRSVDGAALAVLGLSLAVGALMRFGAGGRSRWLYAAGAALGLGLASGSSFWLGALTLALTLLALRFTQPDVGGALSDLGGRLRPEARTFVIILVLTTLVIATVGLTYLRGLGALVDNTIGWVGGFAPSSEGRPPLVVLIFLAAYEPLLVVLGIAGAVRAFRQGRRLGQALAWFSLIALALLLVYGRRGLPDILWVTAPLGMLAGWELFESLAANWTRADLPIAAAQAGIMAALAGFAMLNVASYANIIKNGGGDSTATVLGMTLQVSSGANLWVAALAVFLIFVVAYLVALGWSGMAARLGLLLSGSGLLLAMTLSAGWGLTQLRPDSPAELWWAKPAAADVTRMLVTLGNVSDYTVGNPNDIEVTVEGPSLGVLGWALRDYKHAAFVDRLDPVIQSPVVITPSDEQNPTLGSSYVGQRFMLRAMWTPDMPPADWIGWLVYRRIPAVEPETVILWVRQDIQQLKSTGE